MTNEQRVRACAEHVMGWKPPSEALKPGDCWSLREHGEPWERRVYGDPPASFTGEWKFTVAETISEEEFARRFYWMNPQGEYVHPEGSLADPPGFDPFTSDDHAFMLVDKLIASGWDLQCIQKHPDFEWNVEFHIGREDDRRWAGHHDPDRRTAIVLAALRAVGQEGE
jgi:hypothetical protein